MKDFFKTMFASMAGCLLTGLILFFILLGVFWGIISSGGTKEIKEQSVLVLDLATAIPERASDNPFDNMDFASMETESTMGLNNILRSIKFAATDERVSGILLDLSDIDAGYATVEAIRNQLDTFKSSGKFVYAYATDYSQKAYFLASVADNVFLHPVGSVEFKGIYLESMFFKNALAKLEVDAQIIRHGKFKSAVEPYMLEKMSDENRLQLQTFANSLWGSVVSEIAGSRKIDTAILNSVADSLFALDAQNAVKYKLVNKLLYRDELDKLIADKTVKTGNAPYMKMKEYFNAIKEGLMEQNENHIAVIYASGEITNGSSKYNEIGGKSMAKTIREAVDDPLIKAIVFRVNSPGGDAMASELIWREIYLANQKKPVVVSMGDYAASGGYYISCPARRIFAEPTTLTGSIGVFGVIPNLQGLFNNKLGITFDAVKTNEHSDYITTSRAMNEFDKATMQATIEHIYSVFIKHVADGRKMKVEEVDSIGQGRIWSGSDALRIGLVDELGGLYDAIAYAADEAGLSDYAVEELPLKKDFFTSLIEDFGNQAGTDRVLLKSLGAFAPLYDAWLRATAIKGFQARLPYFLIMH